MQADSIHPRFEHRRVELERQASRKKAIRLLSILVVLVVALCLFVAVRSPLLDIDDFEVKGNNQLSAQEIIDLSGLEAGDMLFRLDTNTAASHILEHFRITQVNVEAAYSGIVTIEVVEKDPVARFISNQVVYLTALDGTVLDTWSVNDPAAQQEVAPEQEPAAQADTWDPPAYDLEKIRAHSSVIEIGGAIFRSSVGEQLPEKLHSSLKVAKELPEDLRKLTSSMTATSTGHRLDLVGGAFIELGSEHDLAEKVTVIRTFLREVDLGCLESIDVSAPQVPVLTRTSGCR